MTEDEQRRTTAFIYTRPARGSVGMQPMLTTTSLGRRPGRWVPPVILFGFFLVSVAGSFIGAATGHSPFAGIIITVIFFFVLPALWFCWHWGFNDRNR